MTSSKYTLSSQWIPIKIPANHLVAVDKQILKSLYRKSEVPGYPAHSTAPSWRTHTVRFPSFLSGCRNPESGIGKRMDKKKKSPEHLRKPDSGPVQIMSTHLWQRSKGRGSPRGPAVRTSSSNAGGAGSSPGHKRRSHTPQAQKTKTKKQKHHRNELNKDFKGGPH